MRTRSTALLPSCLIACTLLASCVTSPSNGTALADRDAAVTFEGLAPAPRRLVWIEAAPTASGPFASWSGASTRSSLLPTDVIPALLGLPSPVFAWSLTSAIPAARWSVAVDADGCSSAETFVRVRDVLHTYRTFDAAEGEVLSGRACFEAAVLGGATPIAAYENCGSAETPIMRLTAGGSRHIGDAIIASQADVDALRCYDEIVGSLSVASSAPATVALPRLKRVTGALNLVYTSTPPAEGPFQDERCGALGSVTAAVRKYDLPQLTEVGGALLLRQENSFAGPVSTQAIDLGLEVLAQIGGDLTIEIAQFGGSPCGLSSLTSIPGDFTLRFLAFGEIGSDSNKLLPAVTEVAGTVSLIGGHNTFANPLAALTHAGALYVEHASGLSGFDLPALTTVTGSVELVGGGVTSHPIALTSAGFLRISESSFSSLEQFGGASLALGGLELRDNPALATLTSATDTSKVTLAPSAALTLADNAALAAASVCTFVALQSALGWSGPADLDGVTCP